MRSKRRMPAEDRSGAEPSGSPNKDCLLVQEGVWRAVEEAAGKGASIAVLKVAEEIGGAFPRSGLSTRDIADALVFAAVDAGVAVERPVPRIPQVRLSRLPRLSLSALRDAAIGRSLPAASGLGLQA